jgi:predicted nucleic acid-binding protein
MTIYVDSSALVKRYVNDSESDAAERILLSDGAWLPANHTYVELVLSLARRLAEADLTASPGD